MERADHELHRLERSAAHDARGGRNLLPLGDRGFHGAAQRHLESVARQGEEVGGRLTARLLQVVAGLAMERMHAEMVIDQHGCGRIALQQGALERVHDVAPSLMRPRLVAPAGLDREVGGRNQRKIDEVVARRPEPAVDPPPFRHRVEQILVAGDAFRGTEKQMSVLAQREMEQGQQLALHLRFQVDQHVAAADQIEPRERRVLQEILGREGDRVAERLPGLVAVVLDIEEPLEPVSVDVARDAGRVEARPGGRQQVIRDVGREDPDVERLAGLLRALGDQHRERIGFFAGGAAGDPNADRRVRVALPHQRRDHFLVEALPCLGIAEKAAHADREISGQRIRFFRFGAQPLQIGAELLDLVQPHPAMRPPQQRPPPVGSEVEIGMRSQNRHQLAEVIVEIGRLDRFGLPHVGVADHLDQRLGDLLGREHEIDDAGADRVLRHAGMGRGCRILRDRDAALGLDEAQTQRAVGSGARKDDADRALLLVLGQGAEEDVDRAPLGRAAPGACSDARRRRSGSGTDRGR